MGIIVLHVNGLNTLNKRQRLSYWIKKASSTYMIRIRNHFKYKVVCTHLCIEWFVPARMDCSSSSYFSSGKSRPLVNMDFTKEPGQVSSCSLQQALKCHIVFLDSGFFSCQKWPTFWKQSNLRALPNICFVSDYELPEIKFCAMQSLFLPSN